MLNVSTTVPTYHNAFRLISKLHVLFINSWNNHVCRINNLIVSQRNRLQTVPQVEFFHSNATYIQWPSQPNHPRWARCSFESSESMSDGLLVESGQGQHIKSTTYLHNHHFSDQRTQFGPRDHFHDQLFAVPHWHFGQSDYAYPAFSGSHWTSIIYPTNNHGNKHVHAVWIVPRFKRPRSPLDSSKNLQHLHDDRVTRTTHHGTISRGWKI